MAISLSYTTPSAKTQSCLAHTQLTRSLSSLAEQLRAAAAAAAVAIAQPARGAVQPPRERVAPPPRALGDTVRSRVRERVAGDPLRQTLGEEQWEAR